MKKKLTALLYNTRTQLVLLFLFCGLLIFLLWQQLSRQMEADRDKTIANAVRNNDNLAIALEQHTIRTLRDIDGFLLLVKTDSERELRNTSLYSLREAHLHDSAYVNGFFVTDENGRTVRSLMTKTESRPVFTTSENLNIHRSGKEGPFISNPVMVPGLPGPQILVSRPLKNAENNFRGMVLAAVDPDIFTSFYAEAEMKDLDIISLISPDGITYSRRMGNVQSYGEDISASPLFGHLKERKVGSYFARDAIRGVRTYFSYRQLRDYPVIATVGRSEADVLERFYRRRSREYRGLGGISLLLLLFTAFVGVAILQRKKYIRRLTARELQYRSVFENSHDLILLLDSEGCIETMNDSAARLFQTDKESAKQKKFEQLYRELEPVKPPQKKLRDHEPTMEVIFHRHDGSKFVAEMASSQFRDAEDKPHSVIIIHDITQRRLLQKKLLNEQNRHQAQLTRQIILAQEKERESIGHELHDNINQVLTTVKLYLDMARFQKEKAEEFIDKSIEQILYCISEIRRISRDLSAPTLGTRSIVDAINSLIESVNAATPIQFHVSYDDEGMVLPRDQSLAIYRILQEQLSNIVKHSGATEVSIALLQARGEVNLLVEDNGKGYDMSATAKGIGLNNMLHRAKVFGGKMSIDTAPGKGFRLHIRLPVAEAKKA